MRQVVLDTETTGLEVSQGHRIIEIGCVELIDRRVTDSHWHYYVNPEREVDAGAYQVHGISQESLQDKPLFADIADSFLDYIKDAELIIHNAAFDVGFLNAELRRLDDKSLSVESVSRILDTLVMARQKHPGQKNNLDALCKRYNIDNSHRSLHGALLDARILSDVYLIMTGGQTALGLESVGSLVDPTESEACEPLTTTDQGPLPIWRGSDASEQAHAEYMAFLSGHKGDADT